MRKSFRVGLVQLCSTADIERNIEMSLELTSEAVAQGARMVFTPEVTNMIAPDSETLRRRIVPEAQDPCLAAFREAAQSHGIWVHIGSLALRAEDDPEGRAVNRGIIIDPQGEIRARYDKIHGFKADLGKGHSYDEARNYRPGSHAVVAHTEYADIGMSICYDLRFAHLYRTLAQAGAKILAVPSAFTVPTGRAHWHTLLRARAIENGAFIVAAAQVGAHGGTDAGTLRESFGHSLVVSPWGELLADGGVEERAVIAEIDLAAVDLARRRVPSLTGDVPFSLDE